MSFSFGQELVVTLFGESHGQYVGGILDGLPSGLPVKEEIIKKWLLRRRPGNSEFTSQRREEDSFEIISGLKDGATNGGPVVIAMRNSDVVSDPYEKVEFIPRPGHADYPAWVRYGRYRDFRGGGFFSGRMTAPLVAVGSIAIDILEKLGIRSLCYVSRIGDVTFKQEGPIDMDDPYNFKTRIPSSDRNKAAEEFLMGLMRKGDSVGAEITARISGVPAGIGDPFFDSVEARMSHLMFSIPAVKGIEFGSGFRFSSMLGSEASDPYRIEEGRVKVMENHNGGILGGLTTSADIEFRVAVKPTSSIKLQQDSVDLASMTNIKIAVKGRHDPCIGIRAVPVVQACASLVILDLLISSSSTDFLKKLRKEDEGET